MKITIEGRVNEISDFVSLMQSRIKSDNVPEKVAADPSEVDWDLDYISDFDDEKAAALRKMQAECSRQLRSEAKTTQKNNDVSKFLTNDIGNSPRQRKAKN